MRVSDIQIKQMSSFKKTYKKLPNEHRLIVNEAIRAIMHSPKSGEEKKGDLSGVYVYKFKIHQQHMLLAYEWTTTKRLLLALGAHENFYRDLKENHNGVLAEIGKNF
ncbi:MAG: type II toxin-antitoxin system RelE/ParE family toxin [Legionella sp.]|nr:type II toxin-antitoxin system RelE/ParE family toxin [Legionella sp.]